MAFRVALNSSQFLDTCHSSDAFHPDVAPVIFEYPAICEQNKHFLRGTVQSKMKIVSSTHHHVFTLEQYQLFYFSFAVTMNED